MIIPKTYNDIALVKNTEEFSNRFALSDEDTLRLFCELRDGVSDKVVWTPEGQIKVLGKTTAGDYTMEVVKCKVDPEQIKSIILTKNIYREEYTDQYLEKLGEKQA